MRVYCDWLVEPWNDCVQGADVGAW